MPARPIAKRIVDLVLCLAVVPIGLPLCLALLVAIRLESPGSPLFVQVRVGRHQRPFRIFKLRTMAFDTGDVASHLVSAGQITRLGALLRRLKLDELPQLVNVIMGSMSLVGPRPCLPNQAELIAERARHGIFEALPGVTGKAQLMGIDMSDPVRLAQVEADYLEQATLTRDFGILWRTATGGGSGDAALKSSGRPL